MGSKKSSTVFDLDAARNALKRAPFIVTFGERQYELADIMDVDQRAIRSAYATFKETGDVRAVIDLLVSPADREAFYANALPLWKLSALLTAYNEHYGLEVK